MPFKKVFKDTSVTMAHNFDSLHMNLSTSELPVPVFPKPLDPTRISSSIHISLYSFVSGIDCAMFKSQLN